MIESEQGKGTTMTVVLPVIATAPIEEGDDDDTKDAGVEQEAAANDPEIKDAPADADKDEDDVAEVASV